MSNFYCEYCGAPVLEDVNGNYITGCKHYPLKEGEITMNDYVDDKTQEDFGDRPDNPLDYEATHEFFIAGVKFHQLHTVLKDLKVDDYLLLVAEPSNKFDPNAVRIEYATFEHQVMLGYVPKKYSAEVTASLTLGRVECVITELNPSAKTWEQCKVEIRRIKV